MFAAQAPASAGATEKSNHLLGSYHQLATRPFHGFLGRHALCTFGVHIDEDVFGDDFVGISIGRLRIASKGVAASGGAEPRHDRAVTHNLSYSQTVGGPTDKPCCEVEPT